MTLKQFGSIAYHKDMKFNIAGSETLPLAGVDFSTGHLLFRVANKLVRIPYSQADFEPTVYSLLAEGKFAQAMEELLKLGCEPMEVNALLGEYRAAVKQFDLGVLGHDAWKDTCLNLKKKALELAKTVGQ